LRRGACGSTSFRLCPARVLTGAAPTSGCRRARSARRYECRGDRNGRGGVWARPSRPPRIELDTIGDAHEVVVSRGLEVQTLETDLESGRVGGLACQLSGFATAGGKFLSIVRQARMVSSEDNGVYTGSGL
jgi:hypothetical protein